MPETDAGGVRSVQRAVELLALFDTEHPSRPLRELVDATGLPKTTVVRLVRTLEQCGLLWSRGDGHLVPGTGLLRWAELAGRTWRLPEEALLALARLSEASGGETASVYVRQRHTRVCVARHEGTRTLRHVVHVGAEMPLWSGAASHVLLSRADPAELAAVAALAPDGGGGELLPALRERAARAAENGMAVSHGEREPGVSGVAAPVFAASGRLTAAVALGGPTSRFTDEAVAALAPALLDTARTLTALDCIGGTA
ncbi:IclR family transcriptional regulator [Streptomyces sp. NPDC093085]|uniref:IclR family transcriptional regulator n=1 Tax=Streptomyces sp. NPDC093085 TaxID=3155068 RepID=UPI00341BBE07